MAVAIRSDREIERIRDAGRIVARVLNEIKKQAVSGVTTAQLAEISDEIIVGERVEMKSDVLK